MTRTTGAKNNPPDPHKELEKVKKLFADKGLPFPGSEETDAETETEDPNGLQISTGEDPGDPGDNEDGFECGACGSDLPSQLATCPKCGANLRWG